jgi:DNA polymerase III subunit gamma/tau
MREQAASFGQASLTRAAEVISAGLVEMRGATSPRLLLELMCAQVLLPPAGSGAALADRIDKLERAIGALAAPDGSRQGADAPPRARSGPVPAAGTTTGTAPRAPGGPAPGAPAPGGPARVAGATTATPPEARAEPAPVARPAGAGTGTLDAATLRARWPEVLAAVQRQRRVAWMQLSNATVQSFADNELTLAFAQAGVAKGFLTGGYDKDLGDALAAMFGIAPKISTTLAPGGGRENLREGTGPSEAPPVSQPGPAAGRPSDEDARGRTAGGGQPRGRAGAAARAADAAGPAGAGPADAGTARAGTARAGTGTTRPVQGRPSPAGTGAAGTGAAGTGAAGPMAAGPLTAGTAETGADDAVGEVLTGADLIERELGGRIIEEIDGP